jgi:hypothetical protein
MTGETGMDQWSAKERTNDSDAGRGTNPSQTGSDFELGRVLQTIQQLQSLSFLGEDATERMQQVEVVQDELIKQLDELNHLVQQQIDRLTLNRSVDLLPETTTEAV